MRIVATTICALALAGCASNLPYTIAIGDPSGGKSVVVQEDCVLHLDNIVEKVAEDNLSSKSTIRSLQKQFEEKLSEDTQALKNCNNGNGKSVIEEVAKKWLTSYALDATDPDQSLDRFREYLRSAQLVQHLADQTLPPEEVTESWVEKSRQPQSQWCGGLTPDIALTDSSQQLQVQARTEEVAKESVDCRSLYHVQAVLTATPFKGETAADLYKHLLAEVEKTGAQRDQGYLMLGYEIPWDNERTLVRYGVTFYFRQTAPESGKLPVERKHPVKEKDKEKQLVELIGYDLTYANEATPAPTIHERPATVNLPKPFVERGTDGAPIGSKEELSPWRYGLNIANIAWRSTGYPFSLVIGLKNAAFEIAKIPFSTMAGRLFGRDAWNYPVQNLQTAYDALYVEATTLPHSQGGALWGLYRLLTETPLVGQLFQYNLGSSKSEPDELVPIPRRKIFLSRGIYGGNKWGQDTGLWTLFAKQQYPDYDIYSPPYRHGTAIDVVWSMFNLSHGPAYNEARYVMDYANTTLDDRLYLAGHSGGVQRSAAASRILSNLGYHVVKVVGIAGPSIGQAFIDTRYPEAFKVYLNTGSGANQDVTSKIGNVAGAFSTILDYSVIVPLKYTIGGLGGLFGKRESIYRFADRLGFSNATIVEVERKPSSQHQTPMRLSFTDRLVFDAYLRNEFSTAFREDLERPDRPEDDHPHAFPWEP